MPELPEVETAVRSIKEKALKKAFVGVWSEKEDKKLKQLIGKKISDVKRFGKGIYIYLDSEEVLFIHLRMTGHLLLSNWEMVNGDWVSESEIMQDKKNGYIRFIFSLNNGKQLALSDPRKFAKACLLTKEDAEKEAAKLGPDPLLLSKNEFTRLLRGKKREIKPLLMDQHVISGIGNIYAAEILFKSKIIPQKKAIDLKEEDLNLIYKNTQETLKKAILLKGDSTSDYRLITGEKGGYQNHHLVYNRKDQPCFVCEKKIRRSVVGGRGTYYCASCQK